MEFASIEGEQRYAALVQSAERAVVGLDFDGTLSPIVDDPRAAYIHPDAGQVLSDLAQEVAAIAVITGRPARQALDLGKLEEAGEVVHAAGKELLVFGQYGNERWSAAQRRVISPPPPRGLATLERELPRILREAGASEAYVEHKGLAIAVHTRRLPDPARAFDRLVPLLGEAATRLDLALEPGRNVIEVRSPGAHKGLVVEHLAAELDVDGFLFAGDDLGDLEAFEAVGELEKQGLATLRVCSGSDEEGALVPLADVVVPGPEGVLELLRRLTADARAARLSPDRGH